MLLTGVTIGGGLSQYALNWQSWIVANGGSINPSILAIIDNNFFIPAAANGNILNQLDRLNIYAGVGNQVAANTNMIKNAHLVVPISSPTWASGTGYKSSGTSYLKHSYTPSTQGVLFTLNSNILFVGVKDPTSTTARMVGAQGDTKDVYVRRTTTPSIQARNTTNGGTATNSTSFGSGNVFFATRRTSSTSISAVINTNASSSTVTSSALTAQEIYELTTNDGGASGEYDTQCYHLYSGAGSSSFDHATFQTLMNNTLTALGV